MNTELDLLLGQIQFYLGLTVIGNEGEIANSVAAAQQHL